MEYFDDLSSINRLLDKNSVGLDDLAAIVKALVQVEQTVTMELQMLKDIRRNRLVFVLRHKGDFHQNKLDAFVL